MGAIILQESLKSIYLVFFYLKMQGPSNIFHDFSIPVYEGTRLKYKDSQFSFLTNSELQNQNTTATFHKNISFFVNGISKIEGETVNQIFNYSNFNSSHLSNIQDEFDFDDFDESYCEAKDRFNSIKSLNIGKEIRNDFSDINGLMDIIEEDKDVSFLYPDQENQNNLENNNNIKQLKEENNSKNSEKLLDNNEKNIGQIKQNSINLQLSKENFDNNRSGFILGESASNNNINKNKLNCNKNPFVVLQYPENIQLNMSSYNSYCNMKKNILKKKALKPGHKLEEIEKPLFREFKKYIIKNQKELEHFFINGDSFWEQFLNGKKTPPFKYVLNDKEFTFNSFNRRLMDFIFSRRDVNVIYEKFVSDRIESFKKKLKEKDKYEDINYGYEIYLYNFNRIYNRNYKINDLILKFDFIYK